MNEVCAAWRSLRRAPAATLAAALSLAIGMALATAVLAVLNGLVLTKPFRGADQVQEVYEVGTQSGRDAALVPARHLDAFSHGSRAFAILAAAREHAPILLGSSGEANEFEATAVTPNYFEALGVRPVVGRWFQKEDAERGAPSVAIIRYSIWKARYGAAANITDMPTLIDGRLGRIIGVMPEDFAYPGGTSVWVPLTDDEVRANAENTETDWPRYSLLGRLASGSTSAFATNELQRLVDAADARVRGADPTRVQVLSVSQAVRREKRGQSILWTSLAGIIVALCAVNFATMSLARGLRRRPELAVRSALGASAGHITRMLLTDSMLIGVLSGPAAIAIALQLSGFVSLSMSDGGAAVPLHLGWGLLLLGLIGTVIASLLFALAPAIEFGRADLRAHLSADSWTRNAAGKLGRGRVELVALQVGLAIVCVTGVLALVQADRQFDDAGPGYDYASVVTAALRLTDSSAAAYPASTLLDNLHGPGIEAVAMERAPLGWHGASGVSPDIVPSVPAGLLWSDVSPEFYRTLRITPFAGRLPTADEIASRAPVAVLSKSAAQIFRGANPVGHRVRFEAPGITRRLLTVIGIIPDVRHGPDFPVLDGYTIYTSWGMPADFSKGEILGTAPTQTMVFARVRGNAASSMASFRRAFSELGLPIIASDMRTVESDVDFFSAKARDRRMILAGVAILSFVLAGIGVFALVSYTASMRTRDISIRLALGARPVHVLRVVAGDLVTPSLVGSALGVLAAGRFGTLLVAVLRDPRQDYMTIPDIGWFAAVVGTLVLLAVAMAGIVIPVRRAIRQPIVSGLR